MMRFFEPAVAHGVLTIVRHVAGLCGGALVAACAVGRSPSAESVGVTDGSGGDTTTTTGETSASGDTTTATTSTDASEEGANFDLGGLPDLGTPDEVCDLDAVTDTMAFSFISQFDTGFLDQTLQASYYNGDDDEVMIMSYHGSARRFTPDGTPLGPLFDVPIEALPALDGATYDPIERVGLLINQGCVLVEVDPQTLAVFAAQQLGFGMSICSGLALGLDGNLYISSYGTDEIVTISRDGLTEVARVDALPGIDGISLIAGSENFLIMSTNPLPAQAAIVDPEGVEVVPRAGLGQAFPPLMGGNPNSVDAVLTLCGNGHAWLCDEYGGTCLDYAPDDGDKNACACLTLPAG